VYLAMTGGQGALELAEAPLPGQAADSAQRNRVPLRTAVPLVVSVATAEEQSAHEAMLALIARASGGRVLWVALEPATALPAGAQRTGDAAHVGEPQRSSA